MTNKEARTQFLLQMSRFLHEASELVRVWQVDVEVEAGSRGGDWNADEEFGQPVGEVYNEVKKVVEQGLLFPMSLDEWITEMYAHYFKDGEEVEIAKVRKEARGI